jgi:microcin C transport system substrate-binding protein
VLTTSFKIVKYVFLIFSVYLLSGSILANSDSTEKITKSHAIAMHGDHKYPADFTRFEYTSDKAKKGGVLRLFGTGTFDSLNGHIAKGNVAQNVELIYDSLTISAADEPFTQYGLLAHTI